MLDFPCKYLGLPLTIKKLTKEQVQPIIDRIADQLPGWKADLMTRAGRIIQVQYVLTGILIYVVMATDLPPWALKAIDKIRRAFLWRGRKEAKGVTVSLPGLKCALPRTWWSWDCGSKGFEYCLESTMVVAQAK
jgi:hypothetical protein